MALSDKNILITPNIGSSSDPKITFSGADASTGAQNITLNVYPTNNGTLSFEGSNGQLFSIGNTMSGTIYSVNDISGIPSIEVLDTGLIKLGQYSGNVLLGTGTDTGEAKLQVTGGGFFTGSIGNSRVTKGVYLGLSLGGDPQIQLQGNGATNPHIDFDNGTGDYDMRIILTGDDTLNITGGALTVEGNTVLHAGNYTSYAASRRSEGSNYIDYSRYVYNNGAYSGSGWVEPSDLGVRYASSAGSAPANGGTATALNSSNYISRTGSSSNLNTDFNNTPAGTFRYQGDDSNLTNSPGGTWWIYEHKRHSNSSNYWGTQIAWGWEDNANKLAQRNVSGGSWSGWVYYLNSGNYTSYAPSLTGSGASGTWGINVTGSAGSVSGNAATATRAAGNFYIDTNYGRGIVGVYSSYRYQGVFAMGDSYKLADDGTSTGSLYGIAWSHPNTGGIAGNLSSHGMILMQNGGFMCALSTNIVASGNIVAQSDERLKTNWRPLQDDYVTKLAQVKVGIYDRIDQSEVTQVGVSAQSLQKLLPEAIITAKDEDQTLSVNYGAAAMASSIELAKEVVDLRARVASLEALISKLIKE